jgi:hypothetical protein
MERTKEYLVVIVAPKALLHQGFREAPRDFDRGSSELF